MSGPFDSLGFVEVAVLSTYDKALKELARLKARRAVEDEKLVTEHIAYMAKRKWYNLFFFGVTLTREEAIKSLDYIEECTFWSIGWRHRGFIEEDELEDILVMCNEAMANNTKRIYLSSAAIKALPKAI